MSHPKYATEAERLAARRESKRRYKLNHPDRVRAAELERYARIGGAAYYKQWRKDNPQSVANTVLKHQTAITLAEYERLLAEQEGRCAICLSPPRGNKRLHVDHDHACCPSRKACDRCVRGLLCWYCNQVLGMMFDNIGRFERAIKYLRNYQEKRISRFIATLPEEEIESLKVGALMNCVHPLADGPCGSPIIADGDSYSGYSHSGGSGWLHWASPEPYGQGLAENERIFRPCIICGLRGPDNEAHILHSGHRFEAA